MSMSQDSKIIEVLEKRGIGNAVAMVRKAQFKEFEPSGAPSSIESFTQKKEMPADTKHSASITFEGPNVDQVQIMQHIMKMEDELGIKISSFRWEKD